MLFCAAPPFVFSIPLSLRCCVPLDILGVVWVAFYLQKNERCGAYAYMYIRTTRNYMATPYYARLNYRARLTACDITLLVCLLCVPYLLCYVTSDIPRFVWVAFYLPTEEDHARGGPPFDILVLRNNIHVVLLRASPPLWWCGCRGCNTCHRWCYIHVISVFNIRILECLFLFCSLAHICVLLGKVARWSVASLVAAGC